MVSSLSISFEDFVSVIASTSSSSSLSVFKISSNGGTELLGYILSLYDNDSSAK